MIFFVPAVFIVVWRLYGVQAAVKVVGLSFLLWLVVSVLLLIVILNGAPI